MSDKQNVEFDDLNKISQGEQNQQTSNQQNGLIKFISNLPCLPSAEAKPDTPNIDKIKEVFVRFSGQDSNNTNTSVIQRVNANELCSMSQSIIKFLPINDVSGNSKHVISHFDVIKKFYTAFQNAGFDPSAEMELFFNSLQIYESVMSISFVLFEEHPQILNSISEIVNKSIEQIDGYKTAGCFTIAFCGISFLSRFNSLLGQVDQKLGELGVVKIASFTADIIEVFCRFFNVDLTDANKIATLSESLQEMVKSISSVLRSLFGDSIPDVKRRKKWGPLDITERIRAKLSKFEQKSPIVNRTVYSFERLFKSIEKIDDDFEDLKLKSQTSNQRSAYNEDDEFNMDIQKVSAFDLLAKQIQDENNAAFEQITTIGRFFQHLETILAYGVLIFSNEDEVLNPLLDELDECSRILEKYLQLHIIYKIICGRNYLSKLKVKVKKIIQIIDDSNLKVNKPREFLSELNKRYPNLLFLLCESVNDKIRDKIEFLPDGIENAMNNALDRFKNKFKY